MRSKRLGGFSAAPRPRIWIGADDTRAWGWGGSRVPHCASKVSVWWRERRKKASPENTEEQQANERAASALRPPTRPPACGELAAQDLGRVLLHHDARFEVQPRGHAQVLVRGAREAVGAAFLTLSRDGRPSVTSLRSRSRKSRRSAKFPHSNSAEGGKPARAGRVRLPSASSAAIASAARAGARSGEDAAILPRRELIQKKTCDELSDLRPLQMSHILQSANAAIHTAPSCPTLSSRSAVASNGRSLCRFHRHTVPAYGLKSVGMLPTQRISLRPVAWLCPCACARGGGPGEAEICSAAAGGCWIRTL